MGILVSKGSTATVSFSTPQEIIINKDDDSITAYQGGTWNITNITGTISLPTGAATAAKQDTGNTSLASIDSSIDTSLSSRASEATLEAIDSTLDVSLSTRASESTLSAINTKFTNGTDIGDVTINNAAGASAVNIQDGGNSITVDGTIAATQSGPWDIRDVTGTVSLPTGAATAANQATANISLSSIDSKLTSPITVTGPLTDTQLRASPVPISGTVSATQGTSPWVVSGTVTATPTGTQDVNVVSSIEVEIKNDTGNPVPVNGTVAATQSGGWTVTANAGTDLNTSALALNATLTDKSQFTKITDGTDTALITNSGEMNVIATAQPGVDIGDVTINNAAGASAVNIQDGGNSITVDGTVSITANSSVNLAQVAGTTTSTDGGVSDAGTQRISVAGSATSSVTSVAASATNVTLLSSHATRMGAIIYNDGNATLKIKFGTTASATDFTVVIPKNSGYEMWLPCYTGRIDGIWDSATGSARITEIG